MPTLPERLLLVPRGRRPCPRPKSTLGHALAGAAVTELLPGGQLALRDDRLCGASAAPTGDPLLAEVLRRIQTEPKPRKLQWWIYRLGGVGWRGPILRNRLVDHLTASGVLTRRRRRILGLFTMTRHTPVPTTAPTRRSAPS